MKALNVWVPCPDCGGSGNVSVPKGELMWDEPCPSCNGEGQVYDPKVEGAVSLHLQLHARKVLRGNYDDAASIQTRILDAIVAVADTVELEWHYSDGRRWRWLESVEWEMGSWEET